MIVHRTAVALGLAVFVVLAGTGVGNAYWSTQASVTSTARAGSIGVATTGFPALATAYGPAALAVSAPVAVTNTGTIDAPYALRLRAASGTALAADALVQTWPVTSVDACAAASSAPVGATSSSWVSAPDLTGNLAPGATAIYCVRSSITALQQSAIAGTSATVSLSLSSTVGTWTTSAPSTTISQSVTDTAAPSAPGAPSASATTGSGTTLTWAPSTDNVAVTGYDVYRDGVIIATVATATHTDSGLASGATYVYSIVAQDAAGRQSAPSASTSVTTTRTSIFDPAAAYSIRSTGGACVDSGATPRAGDDLEFASCSGNPTSQWQVQAGADGYYRVASVRDPTLVWALEARRNGSVSDKARIELAVSDGSAGQQWQITNDAAGGYQLASRLTGQCLAPDKKGNKLKQVDCGGSDSLSVTKEG